MLTFEILDEHEGRRLLGSSDDLRGVHGILHDVNECSRVIVDKEGVFLAMAYDIRKAYEGQRLSRKATESDQNSGRLFGVDVLWRTILVQCRMI